MIVKGKILYRDFFNDEVRAMEVKIVYEWILENYVLEVTFGSGIDENMFIILDFGEHPLFYLNHFGASFRSSGRVY